MKRTFFILFTVLLLSCNLIAKNKIYRIIIDSGIGPATAEYIQLSINKAEEDQATALIIQLNTPGGLLDATRDIVQYIMDSKIPVIVYIAPGGSRAGSAGVFITLSAHIAVMAPGTNIGAAHPVGVGGTTDTSSVMNDKITNDAAAFIRTIAQKRNRNQIWAERTVRESIAATENEAYDSLAIDFICPDYDSLLKAIDGKKVETKSGIITINSKDAKIIDYEQSWRIKLLAFLSDPNIAYIFLMLGIYGIFFELYNPGSIFPGVIGGISIIIAAYSLQMLPINYAGLGLILLSIILFLIEIKVVSYGLLTIGGIISFILGSIMLIDSETEYQFVEISMSLIITATILTALFFLIIITLGIKAQAKKRVSGREGLMGASGLALSDIAPEEKGSVKIHGEIWSAVAEEKIKKGDEIIVTSIENLKLKVKRK